MDGGKRIPAPVGRVDLVERIKTVESVSNYLMPASFDADQEIFTLADLSVGALFEVTPLPASVLSDDEMQTYSDAIASALSRLPEHALVQTIVLPGANVDRDIAAYLACGGEEHPIIAGHERMVAEQFRVSVTKPLFSFQFGEGGFKTKRYRVLLALIIRPDALLGGARASLSDFIRSLLSARSRALAGPGSNPAEQRYLAMRERLGKNLQEAARRIEGTLRTNQVRLTRIGAQELIALTRMMLWPDAAVSFPHRHDPHQQLALQIPIGDVAVACANGSLCSDGWVHKVMTMAAVPRSTAPGTTTVPQAALGLFTLLDYIGDGFMSVTGHCKPLQDVRNYIENRRKFVRGGFAMPAKIEQLLNDCALTSFYIETDRRRMFDVGLTICLRARSEREAQERAERVRDKAADIGIECRIEQHCAPSMLFQALPFGCAPTIPEARRLWMLPDRSMADLMPFFMLARGSQHSALLLHNRLGEPFALDPFDSPTAAHIVICGESGSGKSFFTNYLIFSAARRPLAQIFVIDKGRSYATATAMLGAKGSYSNLGLGSKTCINAFAGTLASSSAFLRQFIAHLASQVADDRLNSDQMGVVDDCITRCFTRKQKTFPWHSIDDIHRRWPRGAWIDCQRKRMLVHPIDALQRQAIEQLKARDAGRAAEFELFSRAKLQSRQLPGEQAGEQGREEIYDEVRSIDQHTRRWLETRGFRLEDHVDAEGRLRACVLYLSQTQERALDIDGFRYLPLHDALVLDVARREDLVDLVHCGIRLILPADYIAHQRARLHEELSSANPQASAELIAELVAQRLVECDPIAYFDQLEGEVRMQFEVYFSDFIRELADHGAQEHARSIITRLAAYHGNGPLAGFFDGETQFQLEGRKLCTFELQELSSAGDHLVSAVVGTLLQMLVLYCQSEHLAGGGPRSFVKYIVLDEFWALLAVPMVADLVITGLRTLRKHNTAIVCISQLVSDFAATEKGRVVLSASQHRIFLRQPPDVIAKLDSLLDWTQEKQFLMQTVVSAKGVFSEAMIDIPNQGITEVVRFVPTPYAYWIFSTAPEDVRQRDLSRNEFRAQGHAAEEALDLALRTCAERWPNGFAKGMRRP